MNQLSKTGRKCSFVLCLSVVFIFLLSASTLMGVQSETIYATYVNGFGANNGWYDVDKAEGYLGANEYLLYDTAKKNQDDGLMTPYHLLKAYEFDSWTQAQPISSVRAFVEVEYHDVNYLIDSVDMQLRVYDGTSVIKARTMRVWDDTNTIIEVLLPEPAGGWTKAKVDDLQLWVGAKTDPVGYLEVYYFGIRIIY